MAFQSSGWGGFGSGGFYPKESNIDVLLVSDRFDKSDDRIIGKVWRLTSQINSRIEPILVGTSAYEDSENSPLIPKVKASGIQIE